MAWQENPIVTFTNGDGAALVKGQRVKIKAGTADPIEVEDCAVGATDDDNHVGWVHTGGADGELVTVVHRYGMPIVEVLAGAAIAKGAAIYGAAGGKHDDTLSGTIVGYAIDAAGADGDIIRAVPAK